jgi:hypothetical protein
MYLSLTDFFSHVRLLTQCFARTRLVESEKKAVCAVVCVCATVMM